MTERYRDRQLGASVLELLIVLAVSAVLAGLAVSQFAGSRQNLTRQNVARAFKNSLERARFDSVKRRASSESTMATVTIMNATSYVITTDRNQNGSLEGADSQTIDLSGNSSVQILFPPGNVAPVSVAFDQRGHASIEDYNGNNVEYFLFCGEGCTSSNANSSNSSVIYVSTTGTVAMIGGGETLPAVTDPVVSDVSSTDGINADLTVWIGQPPTPEPTPSISPTITPTPSTTPTPSPSPSPTASASPTATPSGLPTATPSQTPTPTPSPTPLPACTLNQRPGSPPVCQCMAPWFIGKNGKCGP